MNLTMSSLHSILAQKARSFASDGLGHALHGMQGRAPACIMPDIQFMQAEQRLIDAGMCLVKER
jgi:hypothetical protein